MTERIKSNHNLLFPELAYFDLETVKMVKSLTYYAEKDFANNIFDSCKDVYSPAISGPALGAMCGSWGAEFCTPERFFDFLGNVKSNDFVPFEIKYNFDQSEVPPGMKLYNTKILSCNETINVSKIKSYFIKTRFLGSFRNCWLYPFMVQSFRRLNSIS